MGLASSRAARQPQASAGSDPDFIRIAIRVKPGVSRSYVGGEYGADADARLIVAVAARAVDGKANSAVIAALAKAFEVRARQVELVSGHTARNKLVEIHGDAGAIRARFIKLLHNEL